jgi:hypothetical protein
MVVGEFLDRRLDSTPRSRPHDVEKGQQPRAGATMRRALNHTRTERGVAIIEFALVLTLLFFLFFAIVEFGRFFFAQHTLQFATREGSRLALVGRTLTDANGNPMSREASVVKLIRDKASVAMKPSEVAVSMYPIAADFKDPSGWQNMQNAGLPGSFMRVRTRYTFKFLVPIIQEINPQSDIVIEAQSTYRNEVFN